MKNKLENQNKKLQELYEKADENWWNVQNTIKELQEQIEKMETENKQAKEIIKKLMYTSRGCIAWYCLCDKAKQFLKEN